MSSSLLPFFLTFSFFLSSHSVSLFLSFFLTLSFFFPIFSPFMSFTRSFTLSLHFVIHSPLLFLQGERRKKGKIRNKRKEEKDLEETRRIASKGDLAPWGVGGTPQKEKERREKRHSFSLLL
ncbi:hypothetical protein CSUI_008882 [Cystoisospora suis]|uniref:Uncharacterized protein n=1 Tax=Cystoisospora suis TaxID=483139 RepID=A0A2C6KLN4_9APIC|nr:hypothetical protein CSUI_008882 [Cystoisospora suis]